MAQLIRTIDHEIIRTWAEARGGSPAVVRASVAGEGDPELGLLRIDFGEKKEEFQDITWEEFFQIFEDSELTFLYQEEEDGEESRFYKFVERTEEDSEVIDDDEDSFDDDGDEI